MGKGKPRHNNENQSKKPCNRIQQTFDSEAGRVYCISYDGEYTRDDGTTGVMLERSKPWCNPDECHCNPYNCEKARAKWFASLPAGKQKSIENGTASIYSWEISNRSSNKK